MYPNFEAERARQKITLEDISTILGKTVANWSSKLRGDTVLTFDEAIALKRVLGTDLPLEELFEKRDS